PLQVPGDFVKAWHGPAASRSLDHKGHPESPTVIGGLKLCLADSRARRCIEYQGWDRTAGPREKGLAMKWNKILFGLLLPAITLAGFGSLVASAAVPVAAEPQFGPGPVVEIGVFRERLAPYGRWFTIPSYGLVWSPFNVVADWGPYVDGSWEYTDAGWTWVSDDPWGWATCHYGRWFFEPAYGWAWVPGTEWGPAWVDWMYGDGFIGWAPLSPAFVGIGRFAPIPVGFFRFSRDRDFDRPHIGRFTFPAVRNRELFEHAHRVTNFE